MIQLRIFSFCLLILSQSGCILHNRIRLNGSLKIYSGNSLHLRDTKNNLVSIKSGKVIFEFEPKKSLIDSVIIIAVQKQKFVFKMPQAAYREEGEYIIIPPEVSGQPYSIKILTLKKLLTQGNYIKKEISCSYIGKCLVSKDKDAVSEFVYNCPGKKLVEFEVLTYDKGYLANLSDPNNGLTVADFESVHETEIEHYRLKDLSDCNPL